jgi:endonuclease-3 related protein
MPTWDASLAEIVATLTDHYGLPTHVASSAGLEPLVAMVTVVLARSSDEGKAVRGCAALGDAGLLDPRSLSEADPSELSDALKASGIKVPPRTLLPIQRLARWIAERGDDLVDVDTESLRLELANLRGIGPATVDALLLQALGRPVYPVDRASYRILVRHGWLDPGATYDEARGVVEGPCPDDPVTLSRLAHWLERIGSEYCRAGVARCDRCPLRGLLPEGGPIDPQLTSV